MKGLYGIACHVGFLFGGEGVDLETGACQLQTGYFVVDGLGNLVHSLVKALAVLEHILQGQSLDGKAGIHDLGGVAVAGCQVDQSALADEVEGTAVGKLIAYDVLATLIDTDSHFFQLYTVDFYIEVTCVGQESIVLHDLKVTLDNDILTAGGGDEDVTQGSGIVQ